MTAAALAGPGHGPVLRLDSASRRHEDVLALAPVTLTLHPGTATLVTGDNGSGKSTLLRLAAGLTRPTTGSRSCPGRALYLLSGEGARAAETPLAAVATAASLSGLARTAARDAAQAALRSVGLDGPGSRPAATLSSGQRARVTLAVAMVCPVPVICLDEPTAHLDGEGAELVGWVLAGLRRRGAAVLVATHDAAAGSWPVDAHLHLDAGRVRVLERSRPAEGTVA